MVLVGRTQNNQFNGVNQKHQRFSGAQQQNAGAIKRFAQRMGHGNFAKFAGQANVNEVPTLTAPNEVDNNFQSADNFAAQAATSEQTSSFNDPQIQTEFEGGKTDQGEALTVTTINTPVGPVDVATITPQVQPVVQQVVAAPVEEECTFPVQSVELTRTVNISNTAPTIQAVETDRCGNVVQYVEKMTRTMTAGPWVPSSGLTGDITSLAVGPGGINAQGVENPQGLFVANSQRPVAPQGATLTVNNAIGRVGRRQANTQNINARQMASSMLKFRSA